MIFSLTHRDFLIYTYLFIYLFIYLFYRCRLPYSTLLPYALTEYPQSPSNVVPMDYLFESIDSLLPFGGAIPYTYAVLS